MFEKSIFKWSILLLILSLGLVSTYTSMAQVRFDEPLQLSDNPYDSVNPNIAALDDQVFVFWRDISSNAERHEIRLAHSKDNGLTFHTWNLSRELQVSSNPQVVSDGEHIYVGWPGFGDLSDPSTAGIYLARSSNGGETFESPFDLTRHGGYGIPIMYIQDGVIYWVWAGWSGSDLQYSVSDLFFAKSLDLGKTFTNPLRVPSNPREWGSVLLPNMVVDKSRIYVAWEGKRPNSGWDDIYFSRSLNKGEAFCETINLSQVPNVNERAHSPQLALGSQGYIYTAWIQGLDAPYPPLPFDLYFSRSTDGGETFSNRLNLSNNPRGYNLDPKMAAAGDNVYIAWSGSGNILFSRSTNGGETFSAPQNLSRSPSSAANAEIAVIEKGQFLDQGITEDIVYLVWQDGRSGYSQLFFSFSLDGGATFSEAKNISNSDNYAGGPFIASVGKNVYVTWMANVAGHFKVFFIQGELEAESNHGTPLVVEPYAELGIRFH